MLDKRKKIFDIVLKIFNFLFPWGLLLAGWVFLYWANQSPEKAISLAYEAKAIASFAAALVWNKRRTV